VPCRSGARGGRNESPLLRFGRPVPILQWQWDDARWAADADVRRLYGAWQARLGDREGNPPVHDRDVRWPDRARLTGEFNAGTAAPSTEPRRVCRRLSYVSATAAVSAARAP
jgi:hypothetical protein